MGASGVSRLLCLLFWWNFAGNLGDAQKLPGVKKASLRVQINATSDTVVLKFLRPSPSMHLEGFILGYGSSFFSTQYIPMPENGKSYDTELDAEPRYLVAVRPSPIVNAKKTCSGQPKVQKPLQVVVGTLSPSSVYLAWGVLVNPQYDWTVLNKCLTDRFYTVRYREKEKNKKWLFQLCPNTETVIDNLKPNVIYEFGVKDNSEDGIWNKGVTHKTTVPPKHKINGGNGHIQNTYNGPKGNIQMAPEDAKMLVPITVIKQVVQNISIPKKAKSTVAPSSTVTKAATEIHTGHEKSKTDLVYTERGLESPKAHVTTTPGLALSTPAAERKSQRSTTTLTSTGDLETARPPTAFYEEKFISASSLEPDSAEAASTESAPSSGDQETTVPILSNALQLLGTTLAVNDTRPLPEILGTPEEPEIPKTVTTETAKHQTTQEPLKASIYTSSEHPESTLVSNELPPLVRMPKTTAVAEIQITNPAKQQTTQDGRKTKMYISTDQPDATPEIYPMTKETTKINMSLSAVQPDATIAKQEMTKVQSTIKTIISIYQPQPKPAEEQETPGYLMMETFTSTGWPDSKPATHQISEEPLQTKKLVSTGQLDQTRATTEKAKELHNETSIEPLEQPDSTLAAQEENPDTLLTTKTIHHVLADLKLEAHAMTKEPSTAKTYTDPKEPESTMAAQQQMQEAFTTPTFSPEQPESKLEIHEMTQEPPTVIPDTSPKLPDSTSVSIEPTVFPSREDTSAAREIRGSKPVSSTPRIPDPILARASQIQEQPKATVGVYETPFMSQKPRSSEGPERPQTNPALWTSLKPLTTKPSQAPRTPKPALEPKEPMIVPPKLSSSVGTDRPQSKPASKPTRRVPINLIRLHLLEDPGVTLAPTKNQTFSSSKPKTAEDARWEAVPNEIYKLPSAKPKATQTTDRQLTTPAPKKTQRVPINLIRVHIFGDPNMTSVPNEIHKFPSAKPKATQTTERPLATPAPKKTQRVPINLIRLHIFGDTDITSVPNETQTMSSSKAKPVHPTERPHTKAAPKSTHRVPINLIKLHIFEDLKETLVPNETQKAPSSKPASQATEVPRVKAAPQKVHPSSSRPKTSARPRSRPVPNRTTQVTAQPRSNNLNWISETAIGGKLNGQDNTKLLGVSRNTSMEPNGTVRRPVSGSTPRVPLAPARPTHMRRRLLHPSNVTGRPGIPGNGLMPRAPSSSMRFMPKPTQVVTVERTQRLNEKTTSAPEQETVTEPIFNANPVSEIDPVGKPRYTAPHVKYMRKEDLVPCSITESMKHFPTEMATNEDEATAAPQNPPSNLTVVAVEGCPSFVILDWEQPNNDTVTEYKVISKENGAPTGKDQSISTTNQTHSTVENLKPDTSYEFKVIASNIIGEGPPSTTVTHNTESADPRVSEPLPAGKDAIWTEIKFKSDTYSECKGKQYVKRTWYKKFVGIQLCNSLRYKIYLSDKLSGKFYNIGDESGYGEDHCQFVDSFLDGRTGQQLLPEQLPSREGFYRSVRQQPVEFGKMGSQTHVRYVHWYECGTTIPGKW